MLDSRAGHRELLQDGLSRIANGSSHGSGELVRAQLEASDVADYEPVALACLGAAEAAGGNAAAALPGAVSIALLAQLGLVFTGLENSGGAASLSTAWGMPRSLNAGDAMFVLAQQSLLEPADELTAEQRLAALSVLDGAGRALAHALYEAGQDAVLPATVQRALLPAALELGALLGGADDAVRERMASTGRRWSEASDAELTRFFAGDPRGWLAT